MNWKNRYVFSLDPEQGLSINVRQLFFWKYLHFNPLTVKSLHHKRCQRYLFSLHSLLKIHWRHFLGLFHQFFLCVLKAAYNDSIFLVTLYFSTSFLSDALQKLIVHLQHSLLAMQDIILIKQLLLSRNLLVHQCCFWYDLLRQKRFFISV